MRMKRPPTVSLKRIKNAIHMSDFIINDFDYIDFIKTEEDMKKFNKLVALVPKLKGVPAKDCMDQVIEFTNIDRELRGLKPVKFLFVKNPKLN
jgi:hypothetical protein